MAVAEAYAVPECSEKEEDEIVDETMRITPTIFNIVGSVIKGERVQILFKSDYSKITKKVQGNNNGEVGMQLRLARINPSRAKSLEDIGGFIDKWETKCKHYLARQGNHQRKDEGRYPQFHFAT